jgi:hypothetical protein
LRGSDARGCLLACALALAGGCTPRKIIAVDPLSDLADGLIGYWRLDDAPGSATARDLSGFGNNGTLMGLDPSVAWVPGGPEGSALSVQAKGYVAVAPSASIDSITDQVTLAAWMYLDGTIADYATAISRQIKTGYGQHYHLSVNVDSQPALFITTTTDGQKVLFAPDTVPQRTWVHIAGTYDGSVSILYVSGVEVLRLATSGPFAAETTPVVLAGNGNADTVSELFPGQLDEIMLYRRALTAGQIARLAGGELLPTMSFGRDAAGD